MKTTIISPTNRLDNSLEFYKKLGFKTISKKNPLLITDGKAVIEIDPDRFARAGIKLYKKSWAKEISLLKKGVNLVKCKEGYIFSDSGTWFYLIESSFEVDYQLKENSFSHLGNYAGLCIETTHIAKSAKILTTLGFSVQMGAVKQGWVVYGNADNFKISLMVPLMCPHLFFNPSMTYFNGKKNLSVIKKIRSLKIPITQEIDHFNKKGIVDNIIIRDPGGYGFFIFSD